MKKAFGFLLALIILSGLSSTLIAQQKVEVVGRIISLQEANELFGLPIESQQINTRALSNHIKSITDYVLINLIDGQIVILDKNRNPVYPKNVKVNSTDIFFVYSVSKLYELFESMPTPVAYVEKREKGVLTITAKKANKDGKADGEVLEYALLCPPRCF